MLLTMKTLWVGSKLSILERVCLNSFLVHGHDVVVYSYDDDLNVPLGVILKDAGDIIPESHLFKFCNSYSAFANLFRYKMLLEQGGCWIDTDLICLKPMDIESRYIFGWQDEKTINNAVLGVNAPGNVLMAMLCSKGMSMDIPNSGWAASGPHLVTSAVNWLGLQRSAQPPHIFYPVHWSNAMSFLSTEEINLTGSYMLHIWNNILEGKCQSLAPGIMDKHSLFPADTTLGRLERQYLPEADKHLLVDDWQWENATWITG